MCGGSILEVDLAEVGCWFKKVKPNLHSWVTHLYMDSRCWTTRRNMCSHCYQLWVGH